MFCFMEMFLMSELTAPDTEKPMLTKASEEEAPKVVEKPFNADILNTCTARFTRKGWNQFLAIKEDMDALKTRRYDITLETRNAEGLTAVKAILDAADTTGVKQTSATSLAFRSTFEKLQTVVRHEATLMVDVVPPVKV
jgi:hypothetical protein